MIVLESGDFSYTRQVRKNVVVALKTPKVRFELNADDDQRWRFVCDCGAIGQWASKDQAQWRGEIHMQKHQLEDRPQ